MSIKQRKKRISKLKRYILETLRRYPQARNSDVWLTCKIWVDYFPSRIVRDENDKNPMVRLNDIFDLPREDHVKRIRAKIQNEEGLYLPTSLEVAKQRKINEQVWHDYMARGGQEKLL